jgi:hypothetical protein
MNTSIPNSNNNISTKYISDILNQKAKEIFKSLCNELEPGSTEIELEKLRNVISICSKKGNFKPEIIDLITKYRLTDMIKEGMVQNNNYNLKINEKEFCEFLTGVNIKNMLFNKNLIEKRKNVEDLQVIYNLLGGDKEGISKTNLNKNISKVMKLLNEPNIYLKDDFNLDSVTANCDNETQKIINYLSNSKEDKMTLQDFINAMTSEYNSDFEYFGIDDKLN